jgi:drug/metabolite transporter (DMT)-like permease
MRLGTKIGILLAGIVLGSLAAVLIKASALPADWLAMGRLAIGAAAVAPAWGAAARRYPAAVAPAARNAILPGILLGLHFITWIWGVRMIPVIHSSLIVNLAPVAMPFFTWVMLKERVRGSEWAGVALALAGVGVLWAADLRGGYGQRAGYGMCLGSMLLLTGYLAFGRRNRHVPSPWLYLTPMYVAAGLTCLPPALWRGLPAGLPWPRETALLLLLGLGPTALGHSAILSAMRWFTAQTVSLVNLLQFVFAGVWGWLFFREIPERAFYPASALMAGGVVIAIHAAARRRRAALPVMP